MSDTPDLARMREEDEWSEIRFHAGMTAEQDDRHKALFFDNYVPRLLDRIAELEGERDELTEILHDLVMLEGEESATGGGPGFRGRSDRAWTRARERFEP